MDDNPGTSWAVSWDPESSRIYLRLTGRLTVESAEASTARFLELAGTHEFALVAELGSVEGYERRAREIWGDAFARTRRQMQTAHLVGLRPVFRMAAATVCLATGIRAKFYEELREVPGAPWRLDEAANG